MIFEHTLSKFSPHHFVHYPSIALDNLHDLCRHVLIGIVRHRYAVVSASVHLHSRVHRLKQRHTVYAREDEASLVQGLRSLGARSDAHCRERMADACEIAAFFGQCSGVGYHCKGVHLKTVVVVES